MPQQAATAPTLPAPDAPAASTVQAPQPWRRHLRHTYGAIDLGTNNCRLLIAKPAAEE